MSTPRIKQIINNLTKIFDNFDDKAREEWTAHIQRLVNSEISEFKMVLDAKGSLLEVGNVVVCIDPIEGYLTKSGLYTVSDILTDSNRISIDPDMTGREGHFKATRFIVVDLANLL